MVIIKPNWDKAPEWAKWWAVDETGAHYWFENKPILSESRSMWIRENDDTGKLLVAYDGNWEESLQERPLKTTEPKPWTPPLTAEEHRDFVTANLETKLDRIIELLEIGQVVYVDSTQRIEDLLKKSRKQILTIC